MATAVRTSYLALIGLAFLHYIAGATSGERLLAHSRINTTASTTTFPPHAPIHLQSTDAGRPTSSNSHHRLRASSPSASTPTAVSPPRRHDVPVVGHDTATAPATTAPIPPAPPCPRVSAVHAEPSVDDTLLLAPCGTLLLAPCGITAPSRMAALLKALPLLAIPFLPPPVAAVVVLSALATPVRACSVPSDSCSGQHGTCTVYRYHHGNGTVDRAEPFAKLRVGCPRPRCDAGSDKRALSDPFHAYCSVRSLEAELVPEGRKAWRIMPVHRPVADPAAVVAAGGDVCYIELEHMNYREGYYIRCPVRDSLHMSVICCTEFPQDAIAGAFWEHRRMTYRDTVSWYTNGTARTKLEGPEFHDEL